MDEVNTYFNGQIRVTVTPREMRMSHWVAAPKVEEVANNNVLLDITDSLWHLVDAKEENEVLTLGLLRYPGNLPRVDISVRKGERLVYLEGKAYDAVDIKNALETFR